MTALAGRRVMVVEDEMLIAVLVEDALIAMGCTVIGPISQLADAVECARNGAMDAAVLDITVRGGQVFPAAEVLVARGIPFIFASGYSDWSLPDEFRGRPRLQKPFCGRDLEDALSGLIAGPGATA